VGPIIEYGKLGNPQQGGLRESCAEVKTPTDGTSHLAYCIQEGDPGCPLSRRGRGKPLGHTGQAPPTLTTPSTRVAAHAWDLDQRSPANTQEAMQRCDAISYMYRGDHTCKDDTIHV
jgi:hypothetical protein